MAPMILTKDGIYFSDAFAYNGGIQDGKCTVRVLLKKGMGIFFCAQHPASAGRSITNAVEDIFLLILARLREQQRISVENTKPRLADFLNPDAKARRAKAAIIEHFIRHSTWIEYYPAGVGLSDGESFAFVNFDDGLNPSWTYVARSDVVKITGVPEDFLSLRAREGEQPL